MNADWRIDIDSRAVGCSAGENECVAAHKRRADKDTVDDSRGFNVDRCIACVHGGRLVVADLAADHIRCRVESKTCKSKGGGDVDAVCNSA